MIDFSFFRLLTDWGFIAAKKIQAELDKHFPKVMGDVKIPLYITACNFDTEELRVFDSEKDKMADLVKVVRASISIPIVFTPVEIGKDLYVDGGVQRNFAIDLFGNTEKSVGLYFSEKKGRKPRPKGMKALGGYISRIIDMLISAKTKDDIEDASRATVIPLRSNISSVDFSLSKEEIRKMIKSGYDQTDAWIKNNPGKLI